MTGPVQPVTVVQALLLRTALPELPLREGASFVARVASRGEDGSASLVVAGELIKAKVPEEVANGQTLRLTVQEVTAERITLRMEPAPPAPQPAQAQQAPQAQAPQSNPFATPPPPLAPRITVQPDGSGGPGGRGGGERAVTLTYESAAVGLLRLRVAAAPGAIQATIQVPAAVLEEAQARAGKLREDLAAQTGRAASVHVVPGNVDLRA